jgi:hypothetical protein
MSRKANVVDRISYQIRKSDGKTYATFCPADRRHGGKDKYLGIVIDKENGIFYNRNRGYYRFTLKDGASELGTGELTYQTLINKRDPSEKRRPLCLDFGDSWFLDRVLTLSGLKNVLVEAFPKEADTLLSLVSFKLLDDGANSYAEHWREGNYAKYLYPSARLESQRISEFLDRLGDEQVKRNFFDLYIPYMKKIPDVSENVLIDSTGLPNDIHFDLSAINNHNGVISREARLIYVVERNTGFPIFFRYVAGNIVDVSTLRVTLNLMKAYEIDIHHSILDAGYSSDANLKKLILDRVPFLIRLPDNKATKKYLKEHGSNVINEMNSFKYGDRRMFMKREEYKVGDTTCYAYIAVDFDRQFDEQKKYLDRNDETTKKTKKVKNKKTGKSFDELGYFVLLSSEKLEIKEILPLYYTRQMIEQIFDFAKNDVSLLPLRSKKLETFRGHILLSFMATVALLTVRQQLKSKKKLAHISPISALGDMRYIKSEVFSDSLIVTEGSKFSNHILNELKWEAPEIISL